MKIVLLPTDLSVQSLWPAKKIIQQHTNNQPLTIRLVHLLEMPTNIADLLFLGRSRKNMPLPTAFKDALHVLQNKNWGVNVSFQFDFIYGNSSRILKNFIEGAGINHVCLLDGYDYQFKHPDSVNFIPLLKKRKTPINYISFQPGIISEFQVLSILLNNDDNVAGVKGMSFNKSITA